MTPIIKRLEMAEAALVKNGFECVDNVWAAPAPATPAASVVHQWRKAGCADWYDGHPDHEDGGGPYESRTLFAAPQQHAQAALSDGTLLDDLVEAARECTGSTLLSDAFRLRARIAAILAASHQPAAAAQPEVKP